jgi:hypothetical protein
MSYPMAVHIFIFMAAVTAVVAVYLNVLATAMLLKTDVLDPFQRYAQMAAAWLIPVFGAIFILRMAVETDPDSVPLKWIPHPFRSIIGEEKSVSNGRIKNDYLRVDEIDGLHRGGREAESSRFSEHDTQD